MSHLWLARRAALVVAFVAATSLSAQETLTGDPIDDEFASDRVCCIDVAGVNLLKYLERIGRIAPPSAKTTKERQEDFHKVYDPEFRRRAGSAQDFQKAMTTTLDAAGYQAKLKLFGLRQLDYATLVNEWKAQELIVLFVSTGAQQVGHAVFLWGLETDLAKPKRISVVDPNVHPNAGVVDEEGNAPTRVNGQPYGGAGTATAADLAVGQDASKLPRFTFSIANPKTVYEFADLSTVTFPAVQYDYRISGFASVSDVCRKPGSPGSPGSGQRFAPAEALTCAVVPEPSTVTLFASGLVGVVCAARWAGRTKGRRRRASPALRGSGGEGSRTPVRD